MIGGLIERVRGAASGERALADLSAIARFHRIQASPGYDEAAAWLEGALGSAGLTPEVTEVPADGRTRFGGFPMPEGWRCRRARAALHGARGREPLADYETAPLSIVQRSGPARGRFPLVALESLEALEGADVRGKAVLVSGPVQRAHERAVVERGAAGLVLDGRRLLPPVRTEAHDRDSLAYTSFWWLGDRPRGWGVVVSPARGAELRGRLAAGEPLELEVDFACERYVGRIPLVHAAIPGALPGEVLLTSHLCHPRPGANDNASGAAATLECARALASLARDGSLQAPHRTIRFLWMPEFTGTFAWHSHAPDRVAATVAALNLDMVGARQAESGSTLLLERAPQFLGSFADELLEAMLAGLLHPARRRLAGGEPPAMRVREAPYSGGSDHAVWLDPAAGVPCPMLIQWPDRFYHSDLDAPERCDPDSLALAARAAAGYAAFIAGAGAVEAGWLASRVVQGTERRMRALPALPAGRRAARGELERGQRSLASLARLFGIPADGREPPAGLSDALAHASERLEAFLSAELGGAPERGRDAGAAARRVPVRLPGGLLCPMRWLAPGWDTLTESRRARLLALEAAVPGGSGVLDVAWFACDGERDVGAIAGLLEREGWPIAADRLAEWFDLVAALGCCRWGDAA